jgi:hypothetical protein
MPLHYVEKVVSLLRFRRFQRSINRNTRSRHDEILRWAKTGAKEAQEDNKISDEAREPGAVLSANGDALALNIISEFRGKYSQSSNGLRILIHLPPFQHSPGGHSLFRNLAQSLEFIGIPTAILEWRDDLSAVLEKFEPTVLITSDAQSYLKRIDWSVFKAYRTRKKVFLGLTASLQEYGNTPLFDRLTWAKENGVDFFYSFRTEEYLTGRKAYGPFFAAGYKIVSVEFGANPLIYFPVPNIERDLDYVFLASSNSDKRERYYQYFPTIFSKNIGFINGPGWGHVSELAASETHRYLYARAKIGINLHINDSVEWASELNERTYILAACGVPQLIDNAKLLGSRYSGEAFFIGKDPDEYNRLFKEILAKPDEARRRANLARIETYSRHTTFHRAEHFAKALWRILPLNGPSAILDKK